MTFSSPGSLDADRSDTHNRRIPKGSSSGYASHIRAVIVITSEASLRSSRRQRAANETFVETTGRARPLFLHESSAH
jgi:hypothetical protein